MSGRAALYTTEAFTEPMFGRRDYEIHRAAYVRAERDEQTSSEHLDIELLQLGAQLDDVWKKEQAAWDIVNQSDLDDEDPRFVLAQKLFEQTSLIVDQILQLPATTLEGLRIKAMVIKWCRGSGEVGMSMASDATDVRIAEAIVNDLLAMPSGNALASERAQSGIPPKPEATKGTTIQEALEGAYDIASFLYALKALRGEEDSATPRDAACDLLIEKAHQLAADLPGMIDEAHHTALYAGQ